MAANTLKDTTNYAFLQLLIHKLTYILYVAPELHGVRQQLKLHGVMVMNYCGGVGWHGRLRAQCGTWYALVVLARHRRLLLWYRC